jgi:hypothetical protein
MKKTLGVLVSFVFSLILFATVARAQEGNISLTSSKVSCEGVSVWRDGSYRVNGRCDGLVYPYATQYDRYTLWANLKNGNVTRVDDIERGYFDGNIFDDFSSLFVTAETSSSPHRPSAYQVASGKVTPFSFDKSETTTVQPSATPAPSAAPGLTVQKNTTTSTSGVGSVIGTILKSLLVIIVVVIVITIVASLLFRRRGSVNA